MDSLIREKTVAQISLGPTINMERPLTQRKLISILMLVWINGSLSQIQDSSQGLILQLDSTSDVISSGLVGQDVYPEQYVLEVPACTYVNKTLETCQRVRKPVCQLVSRSKCMEPRGRKQSRARKTTKTKVIVAPRCRLQERRQCSRLSPRKCRDRCKSRGFARKGRSIKKCKVTDVCHGGTCRPTKICYEKPIGRSRSGRRLKRCSLRDCVKCRTVQEEVCENVEEVVDDDNDENVIIDVERQAVQPRECMVVEENVCTDVEVDECTIDTQPVLTCDEVLRLPLV